jgi:hypothetical protein
MGLTKGKARFIFKDNYCYFFLAVFRRVNRRVAQMLKIICYSASSQKCVPAFFLYIFYIQINDVIDIRGEKSHGKFCPDRDDIMVE